jgi:long-chain acyl-CoA synthetase
MESRRPGDPLSSDSLPNEDSRAADQQEGNSAEAVSAEPQTHENASEGSLAAPELAESGEARGDRDVAEPGTGESPAVLSKLQAQSGDTDPGEESSSQNQASDAVHVDDETDIFLNSPEAMDHDADAVGEEGASTLAARIPVDAIPPPEESAPASEAAPEPAADRAGDTEALPGADSPAEESSPNAALDVLQEADAPPAEEDPSGGTADNASSESTPPSEKAPFSRPWLANYPAEVPHSLSYPNQSIAQFLLDSVGRFPDHKALHFLGKTMTYRELHTAAVRLATELVALGVSKGDRVAIMLPNCPQAVVSYYGVLLAGAVVVQTNPLYVERELEHQLKDSGAVAILTVDLLYGRLSRVRGDKPEEGPVPALRHVIVTSIKDGLPFPKNLLYPIKQRKEGFKNDIPYGKHGVLAYKKLLAGHAPSVELPELGRGDELAALQYTGGTTGTPKGVMLTHGNLVSNTLQTSAWCYKAEDGKEKFLAALPLFHVFGLTVLMNMSVLRAGMLVLLPRFELDAVLKTIDDEKPTIFPGAPTMYVALINHANAAKNDLSSINVCISGSSALPLEVQEQFESLTGGRLVEGYGLTEASPVTHANPIWGKRKIGTIGLPFPDTDVAIVDPSTGRRLKTGEMGELVVRGPQVMAGYWNRPEETAATLREGWLHTGDLATIDEEGYCTIMDRIKDVIIASGFNVYPREVEEVLFEHPAVREAAVIGVKDEYRGETVKAFIVLKEGWHVSDSQLDRWCRDRLAAYKVPHRYAFRETLPKTMVGKVLRRKLVEEEAESMEKAKEG